MEKDMEPKQDAVNRISRKKFFRVCGSVVAGGSILGVTGNLLLKMFTRPDEVFFGVDKGSGTAARSAGNSFVSPYQLISSVQVSGKIEAFELYQGKLIVTVLDSIHLYESSGELVNSFVVGSAVRDVAVDEDYIYVLYPARVEVYDVDGKLTRDWEACSEESDYCSLTVLSGHVFVTDAANKNICEYTTEGVFVKFIQSPAGFIVPSYSFGITHIDGVIYCSNPGRHLVESYSLEGEYIASFGKTGGSAGSFSGCCNPVYLSGTPTGEIITSEKGTPRISCYGKNGDFHGILLDEKMLGGGHDAYEVRAWNDKLVVAGKSVLSIFQYDKKLAAQTACSSCGIDCPLKVGVTI